MAEITPTWSVVATVDEPPALIQAFVSWYLHLGASEVFLYFDRPDDPAIPTVAAIPGVQAFCCDDQHWERLGPSRPHRHQIRQTRNANDAYRRAQATWLLHVDADEYVRVNRRVSELLGRVSTTADYALVPVAERVHLNRLDDTIFAGVFRRPFPGKADEGRHLFGPDFDLTFRGLTGHAIGKSFVRVGGRMEMSVHRPKPQGQGKLVDARLGAAELLHFDGLTRLQWVYKLLRKADAFTNQNGMPPSPHRGRQIAAILLEPQTGFAIYDRIKRMTPDVQAQLESLDLLCADQFDPAAELTSVFRDHPVDLSPEAADAWLWAQKGDLLRCYGLQPHG